MIPESHENPIIPIKSTLSIYRSIDWSTNQSINQSIYLSIYLSLNLSPTISHYIPFKLQYIPSNHHFSWSSIHVRRASDPDSQGRARPLRRAQVCSTRPQLCQWSLGFEAIYRWDNVGKTITNHPSGNDWSSDYGWNGQIPSGKHTKKLWNITIFDGQVNNKWAIFYSHVSLPEANPRNGDEMGHLAVQPPSSPRTSTFWWWRACITIR